MDDDDSQAESQPSNIIRISLSQDFENNLKSHSHVGDTVLVMAMLMVQRGQFCHQSIRLVTNMFHPQRPSPTSILSILIYYHCSETFFSRKTEDGISQAGTHLIIIDESPCGSTNAEKSNSAILNYYRQFMIKGNNDRSVAGIRYSATINNGPQLWSITYGP